MFRNLGLTELLIILALVILFIGGKRIPEFFRGVREAIKEYKKGTSGSGIDNDTEDK